MNEAVGFGVFSSDGEPPRVGFRVGAGVLDLPASGLGSEFAVPSLNTFLARGRTVWESTLERIGALVERGADLVPLERVRLHLPFAVADYVDFYSSLEHATNLGRLFRPEAEPLLPNWRHLPVGYHGRAGTVVVSGTPVLRPCGQVKGPEDSGPRFGPSRRLDIELELGFVVGVGSRHGSTVSTAAFRDHVFGVALVNDWSARDIQAWEYQPLEYLRATGDWALDVELEVEVAGTVVSRTNTRGLYWTMPQQLAHATVNGASVRTGDLFASGTISGPDRGSEGSLIELTSNGTHPIRLGDGSTRTFLEDGDEVVLRGRAGELELGEVRGRVLAARC